MLRDSGAIEGSAFLSAGLGAGTPQQAKTFVSDFYWENSHTKVKLALERNTEIRVFICGKDVLVILLTMVALPYLWI